MNTHSNTAQYPNSPQPDAVTEQAPLQGSKRGVVAATIGNVMEWYDMSMYALLAVYISANFFPTADPAVGIIQTFAVFGISFLIRPLGGLILGAYADKRGMKKALTLTIQLMFIGTAINAFLPGYDTIGILAPIGIILARLIQGFSAGGEFGAATSYLIAQTSSRRSFLGSFQFASQGLGGLVSILLVTFLTMVMSDADMTAWGWRIPFYVGLLIGPVGYYIRRHVEEAPLARAEKPHRDSPIVDIFKTQKIGIFIAAGALAMSTGLTYMLSYIPTFGVENLGMDAATSFSSTIIPNVILTFATPFAGMLADRIGRLKLMVPAAIATAIIIVPMFIWVTETRSYAILVVSLAVLAFLKTIYFAPLPTLMSDAFAARSRATGLSFSYNASVAAFGGFTPLIATSLINATGTAVAPAYYVIGIAALSICALFAGMRFRAIR